MIESILSNVVDWAVNHLIDMVALGGSADAGEESGPCAAGRRSVVLYFSAVLWRQGRLATSLSR